MPNIFLIFTVALICPFQVLAQTYGGYVRPTTPPPDYGAMTRSLSSELLEIQRQREAQGITYQPARVQRSRVDRDFTNRIDERNVAVAKRQDRIQYYESRKIQLTNEYNTAVNTLNSADVKSHYYIISEIARKFKQAAFLEIQLYYNQLSWGNTNPDQFSEMCNSVILEYQQIIQEFQRLEGDLEILNEGSVEFARVNTELTKIYNQTIISMISKSINYDGYTFYNRQKYRVFLNGVETSTHSLFKTLKQFF